jgi:hypothetical protein
VSTGHDSCARPEASKTEIRIGARSLSQGHINVQSIICPSTGNGDFEMMRVDVTGRRRINAITVRVNRDDHAGVSARTLSSGDIPAMRFGQMSNVRGFRAIVRARVNE